MRDTPLGYLECLRYAVVEGSTTDIYWFALSLPGMPVRVETYDDGALLYLMEMIENIMPAPTPALQD
ncbi:MAG: hypothetical protein ACRDWS_06540 [Acidimicrobiia bacterium]